MSNLRCFTVLTVIRMPVKPSVADGHPECNRWMAGAYFKWPRCAVCWKGELLSTRGALADKLNELMHRS